MPSWFIKLSNVLFAVIYLAAVAVVVQLTYALQMWLGWVWPVAVVISGVHGALWVMVLIGAWKKTLDKGKIKND